MVLLKDCDNCGERTAHRTVFVRYDLPEVTTCCKCGHETKRYLDPDEYEDEDEHDSDGREE